MGSKIGKISIIKKEYNRNSGSLEASLASNGYQRFPGTGVRFEVYCEPNGTFRTGLDPEALYIKKMQNKEQRDAEIARVKSLRDDLESITGFDLSSRSEFFSKRHDDRVQFKSDIVKLIEGDNIFNLEDPGQAISYAWLRVHPLIASSYEAWERGEYPSTTQFFINDENIEQEITYKKKANKNKAIGLLETMSLEKRKKVARLLGLPISDDSKETFVYNLLDSWLNQSEIKDGDNKGSSPVEVFIKIAGYDEKLLHIKDLVDSGIKHSVLRVKNNRLYDGSIEVARDKDEFVNFLIQDKNQEDLIALETKVNSKKLLLTK